MGNATFIGRVGALAVVLGVGFALAMTPTTALAESKLDATALVMGTSAVPTPDEFWVESVKDQFIAPTHPGQDIEYVALTTPEEMWPFTGLVRLLCLAQGPQDVCGPGGPAWPDEPLWKLSGLFDLTLRQSGQAGLVALEDAMAKNGNDHLVIFGHSQGAGSAELEKRKLAEQYPPGTEAPDIDFVLAGDPYLPNGGTATRFWGLYLPIIDWYFDGPAATDTQFDTVVITRQYDGFADFPLYPLNLVADLNAILGLVYAHSYVFDVSLAGNPSESYEGTHGRTSYYFFETQDLPLFGPLRTLGVPESVIDVFEPFVRETVELGYDRGIPAWEPTPARLVPPLNPVTVAADLVDAVGEGIHNALPITGSAAPLSISASPAESANAYASERGTSQAQVPDADQATLREEVTDMGQVSDTDQVTDTDGLTDTDQVTDTVQDQTAAATVSTFKPVEQAGMPATHRPSERGPRGAFGQRIHGLLHPRDGSTPTTHAPAVGGGSDTVGPSSTDGPSQGDSEGNGSAGSDADAS